MQASKKLSGELTGLLIRPYQPTDNDIIVHSWLTSYDRKGWVGPLHKRDYWAAYKATVERILASDQTVTLVICPAEAPTQVMAWACVQPGDIPTIHYVYTKAEYGYRKKGLARALIECAFPEAKEFQHTFHTSVIGKLPIKTKYAPNTARRL